MDAGYAVSAIDVFSMVLSWNNRMFSRISMFSRTACYNDSRQCHAKDVILILHGYIGLRRVIKVLLECMCLLSTFTYSS